VAITTVQTRYRFRTDTLTVDSGSAVWGAAENTTFVPTPNNRNVAFRLRFEIQNTGSTTTGATAWNLFCSKNGGAYAQLTSSSTIGCKLSSAASSDADNTSLTVRRLTADSGTFTNGQYDNSGTTANITMAAGSVTELEFGIILDSNALRTTRSISGSIAAARRRSTLTPRRRGSRSTRRSIR